MPYSARLWVQPPRFWPAIGLLGTLVVLIGGALARARGTECQPHRVAPRISNLAPVVGLPAVPAVIGGGSSMALDFFNGFRDFVTSLVAAPEPEQFTCWPTT